LTEPRSFSRARARWLEKAGRFDEATMALTDAFALPDTTEGHAHDRLRMGELYRKTHTNTVGLGDLLLAEYDRVTAIAGRVRRVTAPAAMPRAMAKIA